MRHTTTEALMDYVDGRASEDEKSSIDSHLSICKDCLELKQELHSLAVRLREDASFEPPAELFQWGVNLFQPIIRTETGGLPSTLRRLSSIRLISPCLPVYAASAP